jgi:hypothetical protein
MTYDRVHIANHEHAISGAVASHSAELVRGDLHREQAKAPSSAPSGHLLPKGRRGDGARVSEEHT